MVCACCYNEVCAFSFIQTACLCLHLHMNSDTALISDKFDDEYHKQETAGIAAN